MEIGKRYAGKTFVDLLQKRKEEVKINKDGWGKFFATVVLFLFGFRNKTVPQPVKKQIQRFLFAKERKRLFSFKNRNCAARFAVHNAFSYRAKNFGNFNKSAAGISLSPQPFTTTLLSSNSFGSICCKLLKNKILKTSSAVPKIISFANGCK